MRVRSLSTAARNTMNKPIENILYETLDRLITALEKTRDHVNPVTGFERPEVIAARVALACGRKNGLHLPPNNRATIVRRARKRYQADDLRVSDEARVSEGHDC